MTTAPPQAPLAIPGPPRHWLLGNLRELAPETTRFQTIQGWRRTYGDVFEVAVGRRTMVFLADPVAIKRVLLDNAKNYPKSAAYDKLRPMLGDGLLTSGGDFWLRQRRMMQPYFHQKYVTGLLPPMIMATSELLDRWAEQARTGEAFDVSRDMMALTLRIVGLTLLGADVAREARAVGESMPVLLEAANKAFFSLFERPEWWPSRDQRRARAAREALDAIVYRLIAERRAAMPLPEDHPRSLLDMLIAATDEETGQGMTDQQLRDEVMTIFLAGHETTASALTWAFYNLSRHPEAFRRVREEVDAVLGDREPTYEDLAKLAYTGRVIDETMRLYPPIYVIQRMAVEADELAGFAIPAGTAITISIMATHHNPRYWENPEGFDPDRFLPEHAQGREKYAFMPFSGGGRICIGNNFALMEAKLVLAMVARKYRLDLVPGHPVVPLPVITLRPQQGVLVTAHPR